MRPDAWLSRRAPNVPFRLNRDSQQAKGLVFWAPLTNGRAFDWITGKDLTKIGTTTAFAGPIAERLCWNINGANSDGLYLDSTVITATPVTMVAWVYCTSDTGNQVAVSIGDTAGNTDWLALRYAGNVAGDPIRAGSSAASVENLSSTTVPYPINVWSHATAVFGSSTARESYLNADAATRGANATSNTPTSLDRIGIGFRASLAGGNNIIGYMADVRLYNRILSRAEIWTLWDPATRWELFEPVVRLWVVGKPPAVAAYTLTADQGSFTSAGQDATLKATRLLTADQASFTETGQSANLLFGHTLTAAQASFTLAGQTANLLRGYPLIAAQGNYALAGQDATLKAARLLTADQASVTYTGQSANLLFGHTLAAAQTSFTLAGQTAGLVRGYPLIAAQGNYALAGQAANLLASRLLSAAQGSYSLSGQAANLVYTPVGAYTLSAQTGIYAIVGQVANLLVGHLLSAQNGNYAITDQPAGLVVARLLSAAFGTYALDGQVVTLLFSGAVAPETPIDRVFVIAAEGRIYVIVAENRVMAVAAESRVYGIAAEHRIMTVPAEDRTLSIEV